MVFYVGTGLQLFGFGLVGICFFSGIAKGDYEKVELIQFILGMASFYLGHILKAKKA